MKRSTILTATCALALSAGACLAVIATQDAPKRSALIPAKTMEPPISDMRVPVHALVREDVFSGFLQSDMNRFERGEKNIELLLAQRPEQKGNLLAWKASAKLYRALIAHEANKPEEFKRLYNEANDLFAEAGKEKTGNEGYGPILGGSYAVFADRLPKELREEGWKKSYEAYSGLYKQQANIIKVLPPHLSGELLAGLAMSSQRTGKSEECAKYLDLIISTLPNSPYTPIAKKWKADPSSAAKSSIACISCHEAGRLDDRLKALDKK